MNHVMRLLRLTALGCALSVTVLPGAAMAADIGKGREIYVNFCSGCHGYTGRGAMPGIPDFTIGERLMQPDAIIVESIRNGINAMPGFRGIISDFQLFDVVAYLRTMQ